MCISGKINELFMVSTTLKKTLSHENKIVCIRFLKKRKQVVSTLFALIKNE